MNSFEDELRNALRRRAAPKDFAEKVLARTRGVPPAGAKGWLQFSHFLSLPVFRFAMAAAAVCLLIVAGLVHHERQEGEMARAQVTQALRIASAKLNVARRKVEGIGREASDRRL